MGSAVLSSLSNGCLTRTSKTHVYGGSICRRQRRSVTPGAERAPFCQCFSEAFATALVWQECTESAEGAFC